VGNLGGVWHSGLAHGMVVGGVQGGVQGQRFRGHVVRRGGDENKLKTRRRRRRGEKILDLQGLEMQFPRAWRVNKDKDSDV